MKKILLTKGLVTIVNDKDFANLSRYKWHASESGNRFYAARRIGKYGPTVLMHRQIMSAKRGQIIDHVNRDSLDNRRSNIRFSNKSLNTANGHGWPNKFGFKGVSKNKKRFSARIKKDGKTIYLGTYDTPKQAAKAYDKTAKQIFGAYAHLNFKH